MKSRREPRPAVVVTGASAGIGLAIARIAAREGNTLVLVARSSEDLEAAAADMRRTGAEAFALPLDLLAPGAPASLEDFLARQGLFCDVLVNSAGYGLRGAAIKLDAAEQIGIVDLNIRALTGLTLAFLPGMVARRRGGVLNLSSIASFAPGPYMAAYYASKAFVRSFSLALHQELRNTGVTVTCVAPGPVPTAFLHKSGARQGWLFRAFPMLGAEGVAERSWCGFRAGRRLVVPGFAARLAVLAAAMLPAAALSPLVGTLQLGGNDPCPCGSGKEYKKCCGAARLARRRGGRIAWPTGRRRR